MITLLVYILRCKMEMKSGKELTSPLGIIIGKTETRGSCRFYEEEENYRTP